jgi:glycosyltransferase involved in cell wall biosynthesis
MRGTCRKLRKIVSSYDPRFSRDLPASPQIGNSPAAMSLDLSIIVPLYNEEDNVRPMWEAVVAAVRPLALESELLFVDDGSKDATFEQCLSLPRDGSPHLRLLKLRRNYGQTAAMAAGIEHARGRVLVTMDGDLQNDPRDIPLFLAKIEEGFDLVVGWRKNRQDHWSRVLPSKIANWLIGKVTGVPIKDNGCSLKAYRASLIKEIPLYAEMHRFIPAMASLAAARIAQIEVRHHPRRFGQSKYGFSRIYKVLADLLAIRTILGFARHPFMWLGTGALISGASSLVSLFVAFVMLGYAEARTSVVFQGLSVLLGALMVFLLFLGLLASLVHATRASRLYRFTALAARRDESGSSIPSIERAA